MNREVISNNGEVTPYSPDSAGAVSWGSPGAAVAGLSTAAIPVARAREGGRATFLLIHGS